MDTYIKAHVYALSAPTKGSIVLVGDWPYRVKAVRCIAPGCYEVTLVRRR